jgi:hypothetical protein
MKVVEDPPNNPSDDACAEVHGIVDTLVTRWRSQQSPSRSMCKQDEAVPQIVAGGLSEKGTRARFPLMEEAIMTEFNRRDAKSLHAGSCFVNEQLNPDSQPDTSTYALRVSCKYMVQLRLFPTSQDARSHDTFRSYSRTHPYVRIAF